MFKTAIEIPTVAGRGADAEDGRLSRRRTQEGRLGRCRHQDHAVQGRRGDKTVSLIARWRAARPGGKKPILIMAHMDVVEAKRADWTLDPFDVRREGRLFLRPRDERRQAGRDRAPPPR